MGAEFSIMSTVGSVIKMLVPSFLRGKREKRINYEGIQNDKQNVGHLPCVEKPIRPTREESTNWDNTQYHQSTQSNESLRYGSPQHGYTGYIPSPIPYWKANKHVQSFDSIKVTESGIRLELNE